MCSEILATFVRSSQLQPPLLPESEKVQDRYTERRSGYIPRQAGFRKRSRCVVPKLDPNSMDLLLLFELGCRDI